MRAPIPRPLPRAVFPHVKIPAKPCRSSARIAASARHGCSPVIDPSWPGNRLGASASLLGRACRVHGMAAMDSRGTLTMCWLMHSKDGTFAQSSNGLLASGTISARKSNGAAQAGWGYRAESPAKSCAGTFSRWMSCKIFNPGLGVICWRKIIPRFLQFLDLTKWLSFRAIARLQNLCSGFHPRFWGRLHLWKYMRAGRASHSSSPFLMGFIELVLQMTADWRKGYPWRNKSLLLQSLQGDWPASLLSRGSKEI